MIFARLLGRMSRGALPRLADLAETDRVCVRCGAVAQPGRRFDYFCERCDQMDVYAVADVAAAMQMRREA